MHKLRQGQMLVRTRPRPFKTKAAPRRYDAESAAELGAYAAPAPAMTPVVPERRDGADSPTATRAAVRGAGTALGWAALLIAVTALFVWPVLMGATAALLGFIAYRQGARSLGVWSMTLGLIAIVAYFIFSPLLMLLT